MIKKATIFAAAAALAALLSGCGLFGDDSSSSDKFEVNSYATLDGKASFTLKKTGEKGQHYVIPYSAAQTDAANAYKLAPDAGTAGGEGAGFNAAKYNYAPKGRFSKAAIMLDRHLRLTTQQIVKSGEIYNFASSAPSVPAEGGTPCSSDAFCNADEFCDAGFCVKSLSLNFTNPLTGDNSVVNALVKRASTVSIIVVDDADAASVSANDIETLGRKFDQIAYPRDNFFFGKNLTKEHMDIDANGKILIFMSSKVNAMEGYAGFFNPQDMLKKDDAHPTRNQRDMFYVVIPDKDNSVESVAATLAHEYQHMLNFVIKALSPAKTGKQPVYEETWLDEGLSHLAEDLSGFGSESVNYAKAYLAAPSGFGLISGEDEIGNRGMAYLYMRYLFEQRGGAVFSATSDPTDNGGGAFTNAFYSSGLKGLANLNAAIGEDYQTSFKNWLVTVAIAGKGQTTDKKYNYETVTNDPVTNQPHGIDVAAAGGVSATAFAGNAINKTARSVGADYVTVKAMTADVPLIFETDAMAMFGVIVVQTTK